MRKVFEMSGGRLARSWRVLATAVVLCLCSAGLRGVGGGLVPPRAIWKATVGDFSIQWSKSDILVSRAAATVLSFKAIAYADWEKISQPAADQPMQSERSYRILSAVGPFLSLEQQDDCDCGGAHPSSSKRFRAFDLSKSSPGHASPAKLTDIFPEQDILGALRNDKLVAEALKVGEGPAPASLAELVGALQFKSVQVKECSYYFGPDLLSNFAFYSVEGNNVAVRISLSQAAEVCRGQMTQLGILLPIPESMKAAIAAAVAAKSGLVMQHAAREFEGQQTTFTFATKSYGK